jgi:putative ABC transport system permease protein
MRLLDGLTQDFKLALRSLSRQRTWTTVAVATLALGIGANSAAFTIINAVLLRPLPYPDSKRIVSISESDKGVDHGTVAAPTFLEWRRGSRFLETLSASGYTSAVLPTANGPEDIDGSTVTASYFSVMGTPPMRGRVFSADEDRPGGPSVVVLSEQLWRRAFGGDTALVGKSVTLDGAPAMVIGIMPASFTTSRRSQFWMPLRLTIAPEQPLGTTVTRYYTILGRVRRGSSVAAVRTELTAINRALDANRPANRRGWIPVVMTLHERRFGDSRPALLLLLASVSVLLLIACANVSNLLLARTARRQRELAVRLAIGASRARVARYLACESVVLSLAGGILGLAIPIASVGYFVRVSPGSIANAENVHVDAAVLAFTFVVAVVTGLVFGILPASGVGFRNLAESLSTASARATHSVFQNHLRRGLVILELATALVLLTGAGLLTRSFLRVISIDPGYRPERVLAARVDLARSRYGEERARNFLDQLLARVRALPGVESAALGGLPPAARNMSFSTVTKDGRESPRIDVSTVGPGYFETIGNKVVAGRSFTASDRAGAPAVAVINETMARVMYSAVDPLTQRIRIGGSQNDIAIVGVVRDMVRRGDESGPSPFVFLPVDQDGGHMSMTILLRTTNDPERFATPIRQIVAALDPAQPMPTFTTLNAALAESVAPRRFSFLLLAVFAGLAATLAAIGLYGVISYLIEERTREIGIRVALGADAARVVRLVVGHGMSLTLMGVVAGLAGSIAAVRVLRTMLYQMNVYDPSSFVVAAAFLAVVALVACYLPARRATRVDPVIALRAE